MVPEVSQVASFFSPAQMLALLCVAMGIGFLVVVSLAGIIAPVWTNVAKHRIDIGLKQKLVDRGMSAEEILKVLSVTRAAQTAVDYPCASEVVAESGGEWIPALVLKRQDDRFYVHFVGHEMSENEWVTADSVRFPASKAQYWAPWDSGGPNGFLDSSRWCSKSKPAPVETDL
jgi:hypothetical protein